MSVLVSLLLGLGLLSTAVSCAGLLLARQAAIRMHYLAAATMVGGPLIGLAVVIEMGIFSAGGVQAILAVLLLLAQGPLTSHALGRLVYMRRQGEP
jgi:multisubunit Na+/H+ antiporter MnhG subunit